MQFPNLHFSLWNSISIGKIASYLGKPLATDKLTANRDRLEYARVLVEMEISETLMESVPLVTKRGSIHLPVEYEWKPLKCINCNGLGHAIKTCRAPLREIWRPTGKLIPSSDKIEDPPTVQEPVKEPIAAKEDKRTGPPYAKNSITTEPMRTSANGIQLDEQGTVAIANVVGGRMTGNSVDGASCSVNSESQPELSVDGKQEMQNAAGGNAGNHPTK